MSGGFAELEGAARGAFRIAFLPPGAAVGAEGTAGCGFLGWLQWSGVDRSPAPCLGLLRLPGIFYVDPNPQ